MHHMNKMIKRQEYLVTSPLPSFLYLIWFCCRNLYHCSSWIYWFIFSFYVFYLFCLDRSGPVIMKSFERQKRSLVLYKHLFDGLFDISKDVNSWMENVGIVFYLLSFVLKKTHMLKNIFNQLDFRWYFSACTHKENRQIYNVHTKRKDNLQCQYIKKEKSNVSICKERTTYNVHT